MDHYPHSLAESILSGTAEVESGWIRSVTAGDDGKESLFSAVEVLDEVREILPVLHEVFR